jgi:hypothetical protein
MEWQQGGGKDEGGIGLAGCISTGRTRFVYAGSLCQTYRNGKRQGGVVPAVDSVFTQTRYLQESF